MAKRLVILEDHPKRLGTLIRQIQKQYPEQVNVTKILCYILREKYDAEQLKKQLGEVCDMSRIICLRVDQWNFDFVLDMFYSEDDSGILIDTQLNPGEEIEIFDHRINISYALKKKEEGNFRIWFYTLAGPWYEENAQSRFPGHVIKASGTDEGIYLDLEHCESFQEWIGNSFFTGIRRESSRF